MAHRTDAKPRIAVVDDEKDFSWLVCRWLRPSYRTVAFESAEELLADGAEGAADLIVTDVRMPGLDGYQLCDRLRGDARYANVPVLFLTGLDPRDGLFKAADAGGSAYLVKPIERRDLIEQIEKLLDTRAL
ncbi:MAG: response regulator [Elusimicrobia bacterium]|nr:response regulator [Elusimicrobiota bacterium]